MVTTISPDRLKELLDEDEEFTLLDTRPEESYESWHIHGAINYPFDPEETLDGTVEELSELVGDDERVVTICAKGLSSGNLATQLTDTVDWEVNAVDGGMKAWSSVYDHVPIDVDEPNRGVETANGTERPVSGADARVVQLQRRAKGCLSYVVGCAETGEAVVVDPTEDIDESKAAAAEAGLTIQAVIDTHVHADHVSGGRRLATELGVSYYLSEHATERDVEVDYEGLGRNEVIEVGELECKALYTPGHTSEMLSLLVDGVAVLTADTLHADSVGRTELEFAEDAGETGAKMLYESLHRTVLAEPESVTVLPGHVTVTEGGEFAVGAPGEPITTTVREARTDMDVLQLDEDEFVDRLADPGEEPANFEEIIEINRGARELDPEERTELELGPNNCSA